MTLKQRKESNSKKRLRQKKEREAAANAARIFHKHERTRLGMPEEMYILHKLLGN